MKVAYVGLPCQIEALRKLEILSGDIKQEWANGAEVSIGLFCRENWAYTCFKALVEDDYGIKLEEVSKFDIKRGNIIAHKSNGEKVEFPLAESKPYVRIGCMVCADFSAELADISIGAVGTPPEYSTVIARTKKGLQILKDAEKAGYVEVKQVTADAKPGIGIIKRLSKEKLDGAASEVEERKSDGISVLHLTDKSLENIRSEAEKKDFEDLNYEVIDTGLCSVCGNCVATCPEGCVKLVDERPTLQDECKKGCSVCYLACPRASLPVKTLKREIFRNEGASVEEGIGNSLGIFAVKAASKKILAGAQDGGAVTALLCYLIESKIVDAAINVKEGAEPWQPVPCISCSKGDVERTGGTFYSYAATIPAMKEWLETQK